jgi:hypothetical protein
LLLKLWEKGGTSSILAWPRLAEYFARFKLSLGMTCSLEVLAPTLSRVPLWVQPNRNDHPIAQLGRVSKKKKNPIHFATDALGDECSMPTNASSLKNEDISYHLKDKATSARSEQKKTPPPDPNRVKIWKATQNFLGCSIELANVAHSTVPIRIDGDLSDTRSLKKKRLSGPQLTVGVVVHGTTNMQDDEWAMNEASGELQDETRNLISDKETFVAESTSIRESASMVVIRMVNKIPILDSAEAVACGLVQCVASKKRMWNSFGLEVNMNFDSENFSLTPTFDVRDSEQVIPFFKQGAHNLLEIDVDDRDASGGSIYESDNEFEHSRAKRKKETNRRRLLPASVRLGSILVIVQIHAEPTTLPLPTLSKVSWAVFLCWCDCYFFCQFPRHFFLLMLTISFLLNF